MEKKMETTIMGSIGFSNEPLKLSDSQLGAGET